jgi:hypothetical protein
LVGRNKKQEKRKQNKKREEQTRSAVGNKGGKGGGRYESKARRVEKDSRVEGGGRFLLRERDCK